MPDVDSAGPVLIFDRAGLGRPGAEKLRQLLTVWVLAHGNYVEKAFFRDEDKAQWFVVLLSFTGYDDEFERRLSELTLSVATDADLGAFNLEAMAVPKLGESGLPAFIGSNYARIGSPS